MFQISAVMVVILETTWFGIDSGLNIVSVINLNLGLGSGMICARPLL